MIDTLPTTLRVIDNRCAVTVEQFNRHTVNDTYAYLYLFDEFDLGLDPWRVIDSVEQLDDDQYWLWIDNVVAPVEVHKDYIIYVSRKDIDQYPIY